MAIVLGVLFIGQFFEAETRTLLALAFLLAVIGAGASTRYYVLAKTEQTILLLTGSPIRRVARELIKDGLTTGDISPTGNTLLATDWSIDGETYTVPKSCEQDMQAIIA